APHCGQRTGTSWASLVPAQFQLAELARVNFEQARAQLPARPGWPSAPGLDERGAATAERVPAPAEVGDALGVGPVHEAVHERSRAVALTQLGGDDGHAPRDRSHRLGPARCPSAVAEVEDVEARRDLVARIARFVLEPG